jgi:hypothetical protein
MKKVAVWALVAAALAAGSAACAAEEPSEAAGNKPAAHETEATKSSVTEGQPATKAETKALRQEQKANPEPETPKARRWSVTAEMVVDLTIAANPKQTRAFCNAYRVVGDAGFDQFAGAYGDGPPSARAVWNEAITRC